MDKIRFKIALATTIIALMAPKFAVSQEINNQVQYAQYLLNYLEYNAGTPDGVYGSRTRSALSKFYSDQGLNFDGTVDDTEIDDLIAEMVKRGPLNDRANWVDYDTKFDFTAENWTPVDVEDYRQLYTKVYPSSLPSRHNFNPNSNECQTAFYSTRDIFNYIDTGTASAERMAVYECVDGLVAHIHYEVVGLGRTGKVTQKFFNELLPYWIENDSFSDQFSRYQMGQHRTDHRHWTAIQRIVKTYTTYATYYGASDKLDAQVYEWFERFERRNALRINNPNATKCISPKTIPRREDLSEYWPGNGYGLCANGAAEYTTTLAMVGLYYNSNDQINEAIAGALAVTGGANPDGSTADANRSGDAPGYLLMTSGGLDFTHLMLTELGVDLHAMQSKRSGVTVGEVIDYGLRSWIDPTINYQYARVRDGNKDHDEGVHDVINRGRPPEEHWKAIPQMLISAIAWSNTNEEYLEMVNFAVDQNFGMNPQHIPMDNVLLFMMKNSRK